MSGICSRHQGHDPDCRLCLAIPLTPEDQAYYRGYEDSAKHMLANCWTPVENCVLNTYTKLEQVARRAIEETGNPELEGVLDEITHLRELKRGMWEPDLEQ